MSGNDKEPPDRPSEEVKTSIYEPKKKSAPMQAISMKTPSDAPPREESNTTPAVPRPKLRAISEMAPVRKPPAQNLGNLAPPYDPQAARMRSVQDYIIWGCIAVILASVITLVIWFVAR